MNTILTDDERPKLPQKIFLDNAQHHGWGHTDEALKANADAHEAAVLAKLREQEPVGLRDLLMEVVCLTDRPDLQLQASELLAAPLPAVVQVPPDLKERICEAHDASLDEDHRACRLILMECVRLIDAAAPEAPAPLNPAYRIAPVDPTMEMIDAGAQRLVSWGESSVWPDSWDALQVEAARTEADRCWRSMILAAPEAPAQGDPLEKLTRIQEELGLYDDKPAQLPRGECFTNGNICARCGHPEFIEAPAQGDASWGTGLGLAVIGRRHFGNPIPQQWYAAARELMDRLGAEAPAQPSVPAPWREAVKVMREALQCNLAYGLQSCDEWVRDKAEAAIAQLDALEGGE